MIPFEKVKQIISTYETLEKELASGNIDKKDFVKKSKEYSSIREVIGQARNYLGFEKEKEELIVTSVEEMNINYIDKIGPIPKNDPVTGKISEVVNWLKENSHDYNSIKYVQWYKPFVLNNSWICRVQYKGKNLSGNIVFEDKLFKIDNNKVIDVTNYSD